MRMQPLLLDEIGQSVIGSDSQWLITYWNRASERLCGFAALPLQRIPAR
jgi:PAS domain-containing protein